MVRASLQVLWAIPQASQARKRKTATYNTPKFNQPRPGTAAPMHQDSAHQMLWTYTKGEEGEKSSRKTMHTWCVSSEVFRCNLKNILQVESYSSRGGKNPTPRTFDVPILILSLFQCLLFEYLVKHNDSFLVDCGIAWNSFQICLWKRQIFIF